MGGLTLSGSLTERLSDRNLSLAIEPCSGPTTSLQPSLFPSQETQREKLCKKQKRRKPRTSLRAADRGGCDAHPRPLPANTPTWAPQAPDAPGVGNFCWFALLGAERGAERLRLRLRLDHPEQRHLSACTPCAKHQRSNLLLHLEKSPILIFFFNFWCV